jgi:hypothetical protein
VPECFLLCWRVIPNQGKKVADGQCGTLVIRALTAAGARYPGGFVWGK